MKLANGAPCGTPCDYLTSLLHNFEWYSSTVTMDEHVATVLHCVIEVLLELVLKFHFA